MIKMVMVFLLVTICNPLVTDASAIGEEDLVSYIESRARPLEQTKNLDTLFDVAKDRKLVLLGEASHGTREYYAWRDSISRELISEHQFDFIAVEGDWASLYELNRYVKDLPGAAPSAEDVLMELDRWPLWMWGNEEIVAFAEWLRDYNDDLPYEEKAGFYGKDVYDERRSMKKILTFLDEHDSDMHAFVQERFACLKQHGDDIQQYAQHLAGGGADCSDELSEVVGFLQDTFADNGDLSEKKIFYLEQNALVVQHAEKFYRQSVLTQDASGWNSRVDYMHMTVERLLDFYGADAQGITWAHNTHIGDARFTEMSQRGQHNIGQLSRLEHGPDNVFLIGFATYTGNVKAGAQWEGRREKMEVPEARDNSIESLLEKTGLSRFYLAFNEQDRSHQELNQPYGNRAIGVVYNPQLDHRQNYVNTVVPLRYDALLFFRETEALTPLFP